MIDAELKALLEKTSDTLRQAPVREGRPCKMCDYPSHHFDYLDFHKSCNDFPLGRSGILVEYFRCQRCELIFTDFCDNWSEKDFSSFIYNDDYIKVDPEYDLVRPRHAADELAPSMRGAENCRILDYGSGSGVFAKEMALRGFGSVESYDPFSSPTMPTGTFDIITCFDVIEHSANPRHTLAEILLYLAEGGCVIVGQTLQPANIATIRGDWWYAAPRNGHVTLYSTETMHLYADAAGLRFDDFGDLFALTRHDRSELTEAIIKRRHPQPRRIALGAPLPESGLYSGWHEAEENGRESFRWSRESAISLGTHATPAGQFRVILRFLGAISPDFLAACQIRVGDCTSGVEIGEGTLHALFDFPFASLRDVSLRQPPMQSPASLGLSADSRPLGLAIVCV